MNSLRIGIVPVPDRATRIGGSSQANRKARLEEICGQFNRCGRPEIGDNLPSWWPFIGEIPAMNHPRLVLFAVVAAVGTCGSTNPAWPTEPWDVWNSTCQAVGGAEGVIGAFCAAEDLIYNAIAPPSAEILALRAAATSLEIRLNNLEAQVANLVYEERREEALALARAIDQARAAVAAALNIAADHPGDIAAEAQALNAALALQSPTFSSLPGRAAGAAERFDPRAALPSFIFAVDTWLAIRAAANEPWTDASRQQVDNFASHLLQTTARMRASVVCSEVWEDYERVVTPSPPHGPAHLPTTLLSTDSPTIPTGPMTEPACNHRLSCTDSMEAETVATGKTMAGKCESHSTENAKSNVARRIADYRLDETEAHAHGWRTAAGLPAICPACEVPR